MNNEQHCGKVGDSSCSSGQWCCCSSRRKIITFDAEEQLWRTTSHSALTWLTWVDLVTGVPLLEIVSGPDMQSGEEAAAYGAEIQRIMRYLGISDGNMAEGSLRCDVNVSVAPKGADKLGTKVEIKNMNSFSGMQKAIDYEAGRQVGTINTQWLVVAMISHEIQ